MAMVKCAMMAVIHARDSISAVRYLVAIFFQNKYKVIGGGG